MRVRRFEGMLGHKYDLWEIPEATMLTIVEGVQAKIKYYEAECKKPEMQGEEDQEFLTSMILELREFIRETERLIVVDETGFRLVH